MPLYLDDERKAHGFGCDIIHENIIESSLEVIRLSDMEFVDNSVGSTHTLCLTEDGDVYGLGNNQSNQLGSRKSKKVLTMSKIFSDKRIHKVVATQEGSYFITTDSVIIMGVNVYNYRQTNNFRKILHYLGVTTICDDFIEHKFEEPIVKICAASFGTAFISERTVFIHEDNDPNKDKVYRFGDISDVLCCIDYIVLIDQDRKLYSIGKNHGEIYCTMLYENIKFIANQGCELLLLPYEENNFTLVDLGESGSLPINVDFEYYGSISDIVSHGNDIYFIAEGLLYNIEVDQRNKEKYQTLQIETTFVPEKLLYWLDGIVVMSDVRRLYLIKYLHDNRTVVELNGPCILNVKPKLTKKADTKLQHN